MQRQSFQPRQYRYSSRTSIREQPLHWCLILVSLLFIFLLIIESIAFIVLGAWHLTGSHLQDILRLSSEIYRRELGFGILLVIIGVVGVVMSIFGLVSFFTLRLVLLRIVSEIMALFYWYENKYFQFCVCLWLVMMCGIAVGIIGIIFACKSDKSKMIWSDMHVVFVAQVDGFVSESAILNGSGTKVSRELCLIRQWWCLYLVCGREVHVGNERWISLIHEYDFGK